MRHLDANMEIDNIYVSIKMDKSYISCEVIHPCPKFVVLSDTKM